VCGVDVAAPEGERAGVRKRPFEEQLRLTAGQLTPSEMAVIDAVRPDDHKMEAAFRKFWSLKEAFTKGRGDGLGFEFKRCDFQLGADERGVSEQPVQLASVKVDGRPQPAWGFYIQSLEADHWISVARGPPSDIIDAHGTFKKSFGATVSSETLNAELARREPQFVMKTTLDLVADEDGSEIAALAAGGS